MATKTYPFDPADFLLDEETIAYFLAEAEQTNDLREIARAHETIERARNRIRTAAPVVA